MCFRGAITEHIKLGNTYQEVKKVYSISILYFDLGRGSDYLYIGQNNFIGVHTKDQLVISSKEEGAIIQKYPSEVFPTYYLVRVNNFNEVAKSPLEEWMRYLKEGIINEKTTAPGLREAREKLQYYSMSDAERYAYDEHVNAVMIQNDVLGNARAEGLAEGRAEGRKEGEHTKAMDIAKKLKSIGLPIEQITAGMLVYAIDPETGETALKPVVRTFRNTTAGWVHITVNDETLTCTPEHPLYVPKKGWTSAIDLRAGDILVMLNGEYVVVEQVQHELLESPETTYNFEVEDS